MFLLNNIIDHRIFSECVHDDVTGVDMKDEDHAVVSAPPTSVAYDNDNRIIDSYNINAETI